MAAYADTADLINQYDETTLKDLCVDTGTPEATLSTNTKIVYALERATGTIKAAIHVGQIYTDEAIASLTGESLVYLKSICCELAILYLLLRRPEKYGSDAIENMRKAINEELDRLRQGERVFDIEANKDAGLPTIDGPRAIVYDRLNMIPNRTQNFYPSNASRLPIGRG